jgi:hypothetical protein
MVRLWPFGSSEEKKVREETEASIEGSGVECPHPVAYQIPVRDPNQPNDPNAVTGVKCTQCGKTLDVVETET